MDVFQREVRGNQQLVTGGNTQNCAVIPDAGYETVTTPPSFPDAGNQRFFWGWQTFNYTPRHMSGRPLTLLLPGICTVGQSSTRLG
jgi:hypothetical protein